MKKISSALFALSLALPVGVATTIVFAPDTAVASPNGNGSGNRGNGNSNRGNSNRDDRGNANRDNRGNSGNSNGQGAVRSELKNLNAANASATARANASPNSNVGRIAEYERFARQTMDLAGQVSDAEADYVALRDGYEGPSSMELAALRDALDPNSTTYQQDFDQLNSQIAEVAEYETELNAIGQTVLDLRAQRDASLAVEQSTLLTLTDGRTLSDGALAEFRRQLGL